MSKTIRFAIALSLCIVLVLGMSAYAFAGDHHRGDRDRPGGCEYGSGASQYGGCDGDDHHDGDDRDDDDHHGGRDRDDDHHGGRDKRDRD